MKPVIVIGLCLVMLFGMAGCGKSPLPVTKFTLTITTSGQGTVIPASGTKYDKGTLVELIPTPASGWTFSNWRGSDAASVLTNAGKHQILMDKDRSVEAVFVKLQHEVTVTITPANSGSVNISLANTASALYNYEHGQEITLSAAPASGYIFDHWEGSLSGTSNPVNITVDAPKNITAVFVPTLITITGKVIGEKSLTGIANVVVNYSGATSGQVITDANGCYSITTSGAITITPAAPAGIVSFTAHPSSKNVSESVNNIDFAVSMVKYEKSWGAFGAGDGQFKEANKAVVDVSNNLYVVDGLNDRIQKFDANGTFLAKWGTTGNVAGQLLAPTDVAIDLFGHAYVTDSSNHRVQKFVGDGLYISQWGSNGNGTGQFYFPRGIATDSNGNVYVSDDNQRIQVFDPLGNYLSHWGIVGSANGQFNLPNDIVIDTNNNVYVVDTNNHRIQVFNKNGAFITKWGSQGNGDGQFSFPFSIALDTSGNVYVADLGNARIQKFSSTGVFLAKWGSEGNADGQFSMLKGIAVDSSDNVYAVDSGNNRIVKFSQIQ